MELAMFTIPFLFMIMGLLATVFWIWMIIDCATKEPSEGNEKIVWLLIIVLTNWLGAVIYFFVRRPSREEKIDQ